MLLPWLLQTKSLTKQHVSIEAHLYNYTIDLLKYEYN